MTTGGQILPEDSPMLLRKAIDRLEAEEQLAIDPNWEPVRPIDPDRPPFEPWP